MQIHLPLDGLRSTYRRVPNRFFGIRDFPNLKLGIGDFKTKSGKIRDWNYACELECAKKPLGLRNCTKFWVGSRDWRTLYWGPSYSRLSPPSWRASRSRGGSFVKLILLIFHNAGNVTFLYIYASPLCPHTISRIQKTFTFERDIMSQLSWRQKNNNICLHFGIATLVKSNWWSIINAAFWLVELLLGYML